MFLYSDDFSFEQSYRVRHRPFINRLFVFALIISCLLHLGVMQLFPHWNLWKPVLLNNNHPLQISIQQNAPKKVKKSELKNEMVREPVIDIPLQSINTNTSATSSEASTNVLPKKVELLTKNEIMDISSDDEPLFESNDSLAFNPRLKENREVTRSMPKGGAYKVQAMQAWQDIHGNRFYKSGGQCYKSTTQATGVSSTEKGTNWYFVSCGGKSESEKVADRINDEMKKRFRY